MSFREEDRRKNSSTSRGLGLAAAAIGVGVGAALYYIFSKRQEQPDSEGATSDNWTTEEPQTLTINTEISSPISEYTTISEHTTTDTSVHDSENERYGYKTPEMGSQSRNRLKRVFARSEDTDSNENGCFSCPRNRNRCHNSSIESASSDFVNTRSGSNDVFLSCTENGNCWRNNSLDTSLEDSDSDNNDWSHCTQNGRSRRNISIESSDYFEEMSELTVTESDSNNPSESGDSESKSESESEWNNSFDSYYAVWGRREWELTGNRNDTLDSSDFSNTDLSNEWDVTTSSQDIPSAQTPSVLTTVFDHLSDFISPKGDKKLNQREEQLRIQREQAFRERKWSLEECAICFDVMLRDQQLMTLPCTHNFHISCIGPWLQERHTCPVCRKPAE